MKNCKILVFDNSKMVANVTCGLLNCSGFRAEFDYCFFSNLSDKLKKEHFDLVIVDWELGTKETVLDIFHLVSDSTKIVLLSYRDPLFLTEATQKYERIQGYVRKDLMEEDLVEKVRGVLFGVI